MASRILHEDELKETGVRVSQRLSEANGQNYIKNLHIIEPEGFTDGRNGVDHTDLIEDEGHIHANVNTPDIKDKDQDVDKNYEGHNTDVENCEEQANNGHCISGDCNSNKGCKAELESIQVNIAQTDDHAVSNNSQINVLDKTAQSPVENGNVKGTKKKSKKRYSELELLRIDEKGNEAPQDKCDVLRDDSKANRKYKKMKKIEQQILYKKPKCKKPKGEKLKGKKLKGKTPKGRKPVKKKTSCSFCLKDFDSQKALHIHNRSHYTVLEYRCALCSQKFLKNADLIAHKSAHASESFTCEKCQVAFSNHSDFLVHQLTHSVQSQFTCPECGLRYKKQGYKIHILTHFNKKLKCPNCPYIANGEYNLRGHMKHHEYKFTCVECGKKCTNKQRYEYHMGMHTGVKKHQCLYCGKCFATVSMQQVHMRIHTGETPYTCDICGHKSKQSGDMKRHKITHETEKKFACEHCNKKFFYKCNMLIHMRRHTNSNSYACPECDRSFTTTCALRNHIMFKHMTERPVECKLCNAKFVTKNLLKNHNKTKYHKRNMYGYAMKESEKSN